MFNPLDITYLGFSKMRDFFSSSGNRTCPNLTALSKLNTGAGAGTVNLLTINYCL